jgi:hypothetical protein
MATNDKRRFGSGVIIGVLVTLACVAGLVFFAIVRAPSVEDVLRGNVQKESVDEQARLGVNCKNIDADLKAYLSSQGVEALSNRRDLAEWKQSLTQSVAEQTGRMTEQIGICARLYKRGGNGKLNGLDHLRFATYEVYEDLTLINSMLKYQPLDRCDDVCLRSTRSAIQEAVSNLRKRVGEGHK